MCVKQRKCNTFWHWWISILGWNQTTTSCRGKVSIWFNDEWTRDSPRILSLFITLKKFNHAHSTVSLGWGHFLDSAQLSLIDSSVLCPQVRLQVGVYIVYLMDWLTVFSRKQILVLRLEDHASNRKYTMHKVFDFLNLGEWATHPNIWPCL